MNTKDLHDPPPLLVVLVLVVLSLLVAAALFAVLDSTGAVETKSYKFGGAAAGFIVTLGTLFGFYRSLSYSQNEMDKFATIIVEMAAESVVAEAGAQADVTALNQTYTAQLEKLHAYFPKHNRERLIRLEGEFERRAVQYAKIKHQGLQWKPQVKAGLSVVTDAE